MFGLDERFLRFCSSLVRRPRTRALETSEAVACPQVRVAVNPYPATSGFSEDAHRRFFSSHVLRPKHALRWRSRLVLSPLA